VDGRLEMEIVGLMASAFSGAIMGAILTVIFMTGKCMLFY
jgi:hypothetical protein